MGMSFLVSVKPILPIENRIMFISVGIGDETIESAEKCMSLMGY